MHLIPKSTRLSIFGYGRRSHFNSDCQNHSIFEGYRYAYGVGCILRDSYIGQKIFTCHCVELIRAVFKDGYQRGYHASTTFKFPLQSTTFSFVGIHLWSLSTFLHMLQEFTLRGLSDLFTRSEFPRRLISTFTSVLSRFDKGFEIHQRLSHCECQKLCNWHRSIGILQHAPSSLPTAEGEGLWCWSSLVLVILVFFKGGYYNLSHCRWMGERLGNS